MDPDDPILQPLREAFSAALHARRTTPGTPAARDTHAALVGAQERFQDAHPDANPNWPELFRAWDPTPPAARRKGRSSAPLTAEEKRISEAAHKARASTLKFMDSDRGLLITYDLMDLDPNTVSDRQALANATVREQITHSLRTATTLAVPSELCQVIKDKAPTFPQATIHSSDILAPHGWAYFADPIPDSAPGLPTPPIRALSWWIYSSDQLPNPEDTDTDNPMPVATIVAWIDSRDLPGANSTNLSHLPSVVPCSSLIWALDTEDGGKVWKDKTLARRAARFTPYVRALLTLWAVIRQRMVETDTVHQVSPRRFRSLDKPGKAPVNTGLQVARLTRPTRYTYDWALPNRLHRDFCFPVSDHWRMHFHRSWPEPKPVLVSGYLKGDLTGPLRSPERILLPPPARP